MEDTERTTGRNDFISAVLGMLDEGVPFRDLNLRKVARRVGCAHTNVYNYFSTWEELLWFSLQGALERLVSSISSGDPGDEESELLPGPLEPGNLFQVYIEFALRHPAWYRLIWMDPLAGNPPAALSPSLAKPSQVFGRWLERWLSRSAGFPGESDLEGPPDLVGTNPQSSSGDRAGDRAGSSRGDRAGGGIPAGVSGDPTGTKPPGDDVLGKNGIPADGPKEIPQWVLDKGRILHAYMHGELANITTGRVRVPRVANGDRVEGVDGVPAGSGAGPQTELRGANGGGPDATEGLVRQLTQRVQNLFILLRDV